MIATVSMFFNTIIFVWGISLIWGQQQGFLGIFLTLHSDIIPRSSWGPRCLRKKSGGQMQDKLPTYCAIILVPKNLISLQMNLLLFHLT